MLVEPIQSRRPDFRPREFLHEVRAITEKAGAALIFDEVVNGFRTCPGGAQEYYGIKADLGSYGKVVGGGFPIGIIAGQAASGPTRSTAAPGSSATTRCPRVGRHLLRRHLLPASAGPGRGQGGPPAPEGDRARRCSRDEREDAEDGRRRSTPTSPRPGARPFTIKHFASLWKTTFTEDLPLSDLLFVYLRDRGIHILEGFPCFLTTAHTDADIELIIKAFKESVAEMQEAGFLPAPRPGGERRGRQRASGPRGSPGARSEREADLVRPESGPARPVPAGGLQAMSQADSNGGQARVPFDPFAGPALTLVAPSTESQREIWTAARMGDDASWPSTSPARCVCGGRSTPRRCAAAVAGWWRGTRRCAPRSAPTEPRSACAAGAPTSLPQVDLADLPGAGAAGTAGSASSTRR